MTVYIVDTRAGDTPVEEHGLEQPPWLEDLAQALQDGDDAFRQEADSHGFSVATYRDSADDRQRLAHHLHRLYLADGLPDPHSFAAGRYHDLTSSLPETETHVVYE